MLRESATIGVEQKKTDIDAIDPKARFAVGHSHVAGGHKLTTRCGCKAVDLRDDGLGQRLDARHQGRAAFKKALEIGAPGILGLAALLHFLQIMSRAECLAAAGKNNCAHRLVIRDGVEGRVKRCQHAVRQRIQALWCLHCQMCHAARVLSFQHLASPVLSTQSRISMRGGLAKGKSYDA